MAGSKINPKCRKVEIGVREIKTITIWPMSLADELSFSETILGLMGEYSEIEEKKVEQENKEKGTEDIEGKLALFIVTAIKENLLELLALVADEKVSLSDIDNEQFMDICDIIFEMNFDGAVGKGVRLLKRIKSMFLQKTQSENLSSPQVIDTNTSSDLDSEKEE
jgi:hypothetical protein